MQFSPVCTAALFLGLLGLMAPLEARAQSHGEVKAVALGWTTPFAVVTADQAFGQWSESYGFYVHWNRPRVEGGIGGFAVRRSRIEDSAPPIVQWATSRTCPSMEPLLLGLEAVPPPAIDVPNLGSSYDSAPVADGVTYSLWHRYPKWSPGFGYQLEFSSNVGTPLAEWVTRLQSELAECWQDDEPEAAGSRR